LLACVCVKSIVGFVWCSYPFWVVLLPSSCPVSRAVHYNHLPSHIHIPPVPPCLVQPPRHFSFPHGFNPTMLTGSGFFSGSPPLVSSSFHPFPTTKTGGRLPPFFPHQPPNPCPSHARPSWLTGSRLLSLFSPPPFLFTLRCRFPLFFFLTKGMLSATSSHPPFPAPLDRFPIDISIFSPSFPPLPPNHPKTTVFFLSPPPSCMLVSFAPFSIPSPFFFIKKNEPGVS